MPTAAIELVWAYTYADTVTAILIRDTLSKTVEGHNAMSPEASWNAMLARTRNLGSPGIVSMTISAVDPRILRWWFWSRVAAVFRDELHNLFPESSEAKWLAENTFTLSEFMEKEIPGYQPPKVRRQAIVQGHCHHKAMMRMKEEKSLMEKMQLDHRVLETGCGMAVASATKRTNIRFRSRAGSAHSCLKCGRLQFRQLLWPTVLAAKKRLPRRQTVMRCILAEVLRLGLGDEEKPLPTMYPESYFVQPRKDAQKKSMVRAAVISGLALATLEPDVAKEQETMSSCRVPLIRLLLVETHGQSSAQILGQNQSSPKNHVRRHV